MVVLPNKIYTRRLLLRQIEEKDLPIFVEWSNSETAYGKYLTPERLDAERGLRHLQTGRLWNDQSRVYIIELLDGTPIGTIRYWLRSENKEIAVMALKIAREDLRRLGYGTEAQKYLIIFLFDRLDFTAVDMYTDIDNQAQERCLQKLGFEKLHSLQYDDHHINRTGHLFRLSKDQYQKTVLYQYHYE